MKLLELITGAPFRYDGRNFYKGEPLPDPPAPFKRKRFSYRVYEVKNRCLDFTNVYVLSQDTEVIPL